jgi:hypothetical protein
MTAEQGYQRSAWENRFHPPTLDGLRGGLASGMTKLFDSVHKQLSGLEGVGTTFAWRGESWRWTIEYRTRRSEEPLAVLVPSPENLQLAVPFERELAQSISTRRMKRAVRDGLELAQDPFDTHWGVWSLQPGLIEDVVDLVELKRRHLAKQSA